MWRRNPWLRPLAKTRCGSEWNGSSNDCNLIQSSERPERCGRSTRFDTIPSRPIPHAARKIAGPCSASCARSWMPSPAFPEASSGPHGGSPTVQNAKASIENSRSKIHASRRRISSLRAVVAKGSGVISRAPTSPRVSLDLALLVPPWRAKTTGDDQLAGRASWPSDATRRSFSSLPLKCGPPASWRESEFSAPGHVPSSRLFD